MTMTIVEGYRYDKTKIRNLSKAEGGDIFEKLVKS
jgi:hypothetical protein